MPTDPLAILLLLIGALVALAILDAVSRVLITERSFWDLRCEVDRLKYRYQLQLLQHSAGQTPEMPDEEPIGVDIVEDEETDEAEAPIAGVIPQDVDASNASIGQANAA